MTIEQLEFYLNRGDYFGFIKDTGDPKYMGWISLSKLKSNQRLLEIFLPEEIPKNILKEIELNKSKPYLIRVCELKKEVYESNSYSNPEDYRFNERIRFSALSDAIIFLEKAFGKKLSEIKWISEIPSE